MWTTKRVYSIWGKFFHNGVWQAGETWLEQVSSAWFISWSQLSIAACAFQFEHSTHYTVFEKGAVLPSACPMSPMCAAAFTPQGGGGAGTTRRAGDDHHAVWPCILRARPSARREAPARYEYVRCTSIVYRYVYTSMCLMPLGARLSWCRCHRRSVTQNFGGAQP